jgi:TonB family protein
MQLSRYIVSIAVCGLVGCATTEFALDPVKVNDQLSTGIATRKDWQPNDSVVGLLPDVNWKESLIGKHVEPPRFIGGSVKFPPDYLPGEKGEVTVVLVVSPAGAVDEARVVSSTNPKFDRTVLESVKRWRFTPGRVNGEPMGFAYVYPIAFN